MKNLFFFDSIEREESLLYITLDFVIKRYNKCINEKNNVLLEFQKIEALAKAKQIKYASVFDEIGKNLVEGTPPSIKQLHYASNIMKDKSVKELKPKTSQIDINNVRVDELVMRKMFEWDSVAKNFKSQRKSLCS